MAANQTEFFKLEQRSVIKFSVPEKWKPCEIYRRMCVPYREVCFSQKLFPDVINLGLPQQAWGKNQSMERKHTDTPLKKKRTWWETLVEILKEYPRPHDVKMWVVIWKQEKNKNFFDLANQYLFPLWKVMNLFINPSMAFNSTTKFLLQ